MDILTQVTFNQIQGLIEFYNFFSELIKNHDDEIDNDIVQDKIKTFCQEKLSYLDTNVYTTNEMSLCSSLNVDLFINGNFKYGDKECNTNLVYNQFKVFTINNNNQLHYSDTLLFELLKAISLQLKNTINTINANTAQYSVDLYNFVEGHKNVNPNNLTWYSDKLKVLVNDAKVFRHYLNYIESVKPKIDLDYVYEILRNKLNYKVKLVIEGDTLFFQLEKTSTCFHIKEEECNDNEKVVGRLTDIYDGMIKLIQLQLEQIHDICLLVGLFKSN